MGGPIEFLGEAERSQDTKPPTEFGGVAGAVQPFPHVLTPAEERGLITRAPMIDLDADPL